MTIKQQGGIFGRNPTFNDVEANNLDVEALGIGVAANSTNILELSGVAPIMKVTAENGVSGFRLNVSGASSNTFRVQQDGASKLELNGNNLKINSGSLQLATAGQGIDFSATSGTGTSELFDDYEEGTFSGTKGTGTTYSGTYIKVGRLVHVNCVCTFSSASTNVVADVPFAASSTDSPLNGSQPTAATSSTHSGNDIYVAVYSNGANVYVYSKTASTLGTPADGLLKFNFSYISQ